MSLWLDIEKVLLRVEKPARYVGAEIGGAASRGSDSPTASIVLAFPDLYEIGASYHGFRILYERINARPEFRAERAFAPLGDFEREMRAAAIPLHSIESFRPVREFDVIGFTLQHEMNYTNVLNMLDLAGLAVRASERSDPWPLVIAGGEGAFAPEPLAPFIDAFVLGDGEEVALEILECVANLKKQPAVAKTDCLAALARIEGVYVPSLVEFDYNPDATVASIHGPSSFRLPPSSLIPQPSSFHRRIFDLAGDKGPIHPIVPLARIVHDRLVIEIRRGCTRGCRFCSSGMTTRPVRERSAEQILEIAERGLANTGYRDLSLLSLSSGDYSRIVPLVKSLTERFADRLVTVSLPSLRISTFDVSLAEQIGEVRKTGFTFAPEAGTERLRRVINKPLTDERFFEVVDAVCRAGWQTLKFYFMVGLPTETDADLDGIVRMVQQAERIGRSYWKGRLAINVTLAPFVPKPHTPFQWEGQVEREELARRYRSVETALERSRSVRVKRHSVEAAFVEAVLARGDRRVSGAIERAWRLGCRLDAWSDRFRFDLWLRAFDEVGLDPRWYANRARGDDETFPWDHIDAGPSKSFLRQQREAAFRAETLDDCATGECSDCQACDSGVAPHLAGGADRSPAPDEVARPRASVRRQPGKAASEQPAPVQRIRLSYSKDGRLRFLSHLDMVKTWQLLIERAALPMAYSRGFHPIALLQYTPPLPVGYGAQAEWVDVYLRERMAPDEVMSRLEKAVPRDMRIFAPVEIPLTAPALDRSILAADYEIRLAEEFSAAHALSAEAIERLWREARNKASATAPGPVEKGSPRHSAALMESFEISSTQPMILRVRVRPTEGNLPDPLRLLRGLLGVEIRSGEDAAVTRLGLVAAALPPAMPLHSRRR